jgi:predicted amidophosphoribosyltransferase
MNTLKTVIVTIVSTTSLVIGIISTGITNRLDDIVTSIFVSEKLCPRCGRIDTHISKNSILCPPCNAEVSAEEYDDDEDYPSEKPPEPHPHSLMYR